MKIDPREIARKLAKGHRESDTQTTIIKYFPSGNKEVWLLEVSGTAPTTGEIMPFRFGADASHGIFLPSVVILLSDIEWAEVQSGKLRLPKGWDLSKAVDL